MTATKKDPTSTYRRVESVDIRSLPLGPEEAFVLSRVDGKSNSGAIAGATGLPPATVDTHLRRLRELGAVELATTRSGPAPKAGAGRGRDPRFTETVKSTPRRGSESRDAMSRERAEALAGRDAAELDASLDISVGHQATIIDLASRLGHVDHFQVLGVARTADRSEIKRAYFSAVGAFHPDKYFGKNLGGFTKRMGLVFQRMTEAHDVLSNRLARAEYEAYLQALDRTRSEENSSGPGTLEDLERLLSRAEQQSRDEDDAGGTPPNAGNASPSQVVPPPLPPGGPSAQRPPPLPPRKPSERPVQMVDDPVARRQALARKLGFAPPAPPTEEEQERKQRNESMRHRAVAKDLRDRYQTRKADISDQRIGRYVTAAEDALKAGNPVSALNTIKIASSLIDSGSSTASRLSVLETEASALLADSYLERARYEENNGRYEDAARSYTRSARGRPSSDVLRSAAECYLKAGKDLRQAGELAREAVQIAPKRSDMRLTLAKVYEAAGMQQSAVQELNRALELAPENDRIKQWLKRLHRGGV